MQIHNPMGQPWELRMESAQHLKGAEAPLIRHVLQFSASTPWGNQLSCEVDAETLLPVSAELGDSTMGWMWRVLFNQDSGQVRFMRRNPLTSAINVEKVTLDTPCYDPVSALEALRHLIGPERASLSIDGTTGKDRFVVTAELKGSEHLEVPAGNFEAIRLACQIQFMPHNHKPPESTPHGFTLWLSRDEVRVPLRAEAPTAYGPLTILATEIC